MADAISAEITAIGNNVRQLKASKADTAVISVEVAKLKDAKQRYKEVTGNDFDPPPPEKKAKPSPKSQTAAPPVSAPAGPSKNAAKKAEKAAKKAAAKSARSASSAGHAGPAAASSSSPSPPAPPASSAGKKAAAGPTVPSMYLKSDGPGPLKCLTAAKLFGVNVEPASINPAASPCSGCAVSSGDSVIFGSNAVCRYFSYKGVSPSSSPKKATAAAAAAGGGGGGGTDIAVEEWLEWEAMCLAPAERSLAASNKAGESVPTATLAALKHLEDKLTGTWLLQGDAPSLADVVVGVTAKSLVEALPDGEKAAAPAFAKINKYVRRVGETEAFSQASAALGDFTKAARGVDIKAGLQACLSAMFDVAMFKAWPLAKSVGITSSSVKKCMDYNHGDFQCNVAMSLFKALKGTEGAPSSPQATASAIVAVVPANPVVDTTSVSPQGYINIRLRPAFINQGIASLIKNGPPPPEVKKMRVVVDFSSPNIAKEMHVGHLRSTIIGDAICRVLEFCGHTVFRHNHVGDWGTQFGMLINYMKEAYPNFLTEPPNITDLTTFYKAAKLRFDESEAFKEASRNTVVDLQSGDKACKEVWTLLCDISRKEFQKVYDRLGVSLEEHGESFYNDMIPSTIDMLAEAGLVSRDDGADIVRLEHFTYPLIVRKRDGGFGYDSTDMAAIRYRLKTLKCDWIIGITDAGQAGHFHMCFDAARAAGWVDEDKKLEHLGFGVVQGEDGKKFKTRSGETVRLVDLLDEAVRRMAESGISLDEPDASLPSPIVATPPALLRPGVGAARGAASRGRGLLQRNSASGSLVSSRSTSVTEDLISNNLTEDDMSSDAHTTDVSRTSSYIATGSSFEESLAQSQAASGRFLSSGALGSGAPASSAAAGIPAPGDGNLSSLAERLARAEETVSRDHEKGLLYRQGPEGVAAVVAGEELPLPSAAAAASRGAGAGPSRGGEMKVESLADLLARADGGPGNLKEEFRMLDEMEAKRLEDLNAAASAEGADDETKARWRGSLAEWMVKVDRDGNLREFLGLPTTVSDTSSASDGHVGRVVDEADSAPGSASQSQAASSASASHQARPE